jgi:hypothetical protein
MCQPFARSTTGAVKRWGYAGRLWKPSDGLEPSTPSLPLKSEGVFLCGIPRSHARLHPSLVVAFAFSCTLGAPPRGRFIWAPPHEYAAKRPLHRRPHERPADEPLGRPMNLTRSQRPVGLLEHPRDRLELAKRCSRAPMRLLRAPGSRPAQPLGPCAWSGAVEGCGACTAADVGGIENERLAAREAYGAASLLGAEDAVGRCA